MPTILVADDNSNIAKMAELALKDLGYKIEKVGNGEHAVRKLPEINPDLILADIFMPVRNGYEVCEFVKKSEKFAHVPVVLLQGKFDPLDEQEMRRVQADGLLMKPFVPPEPLVTMVKTLLEEAASKRAAAPGPPGISPDKTVEMTPSEVAAMTGQGPEPEPEMPQYATPPPRVEFSEGDKPLAFGDLLEAAPPEEETPIAPPDRDMFVASSVAGVDLGPETTEEVEAEEKTPSWGGITEEAKQPTPDEPPIKVEFSGTPEPMELITDETPAAPSIVEAGPLPELATSPDEWVSAGPPAAKVGTESSEDWEVSAPAAAPLAEEPSAVMAPPSAPQSAPPPPLPYEKPKFEELVTPAPQADAIPAEVAPPSPPPAVEPPPAPVAAVPQAVSFAAPAQLDPAVVDAVVEKVLARLQPLLLDQISREIVRPLAEALLRKETEK